MSAINNGYIKGRLTYIPSPVMVSEEVEVKEGVIIVECGGSQNPSPVASKKSILSFIAKNEIYEKVMKDGVVGKTVKLKYRLTGEYKDVNGVNTLVESKIITSINFDNAVTQIVSVEAPVGITSDASEKDSSKTVSHSKDQHKAGNINNLDVNKDNNINPIAGPNRSALNIPYNTKSEKNSKEEADNLLKVSASSGKEIGQDSNISSSETPALKSVNNENKEEPAKHKKTGKENRPKDNKYRNLSKHNGKVTEKVARVVAKVICLDTDGSEIESDNIVTEAVFNRHKIVRAEKLQKMNAAKIAAAKSVDTSTSRKDDSRNEADTGKILVQTQIIENKTTKKRKKKKKNNSPSTEAPERNASVG